jgi:uncharacterized protein (DUF302 family)
MPAYSFTKPIEMTFDKALEIIPGKLKEEGFGVLTEIDVKATLKKKLDVDLPKYMILGACNPPFAHKSLLAEPDIGVLLPCNVVIYENDGKTILSVMKPSIAMGMVDNSELANIAGEVETRLKRFFDSIK